MNGDDPSALGRELRVIKRLGIAILAVLATLASVSLYSQVRFWLPSSRIELPPPPRGWDQVRSQMDAQLFDAALALAVELTDEAPYYYYGHSCTGMIHLAVGQAEEEKIGLFHRADGIEVLHSQIGPHPGIVRDLLQRDPDGRQGCRIGDLSSREPSQEPHQLHPGVTRNTDNPYPDHGLSPSPNPRKKCSTRP